MEGAKPLSIVGLVVDLSPIEMKWNKRQDGEREREETSNPLKP